MWLLALRMRVLDIYCQTKLFLKLVGKPKKNFISLIICFENGVHTICSYYFYYSFVLAKQKPDTTSKLRRLVKSKHPYVEHNLSPVLSIIRHSIQNAAAYEAIAEHLKVGLKEIVRPRWSLMIDTYEAIAA